MTAEEVAMTERICAVHLVPIVVEPGGPHMPTVHGRTYCPQCQSDMNTALDKVDEQVLPTPGQAVTHLHETNDTRLEFITDLLKHLREEHHWSDEDDRWMSPMRALRDFHHGEHNG